jgi:hypothetical protein
MWGYLLFCLKGNVMATVHGGKTIKIKALLNTLLEDGPMLACEIEAIVRRKKITKALLAQVRRREHIQICRLPIIGKVWWLWGTDEELLKNALADMLWQHTITADRQRELEEEVRLAEKCRRQRKEELKEKAENERWMKKHPGWSRWQEKEYRQQAAKRKELNRLAAERILKLEQEGHYLPKLEEKNVLESYNCKPEDRRKLIRKLRSQLLVHLCVSADAMDDYMAKNKRHSRTRVINEFLAKLIPQHATDPYVQKLHGHIKLLQTINLKGS